MASPERQSSERDFKSIKRVVDRLDIVIEKSADRRIAFGHLEEWAKRYSDKRFQEAINEIQKYVSKTAAVTTVKTFCKCLFPAAEIQHLESSSTECITDVDELRTIMMRKGLLKPISDLDFNRITKTVVGQRGRINPSFITNVVDLPFGGTRSLIVGMDPVTDTSLEIYFFVIEHYTRQESLEMDPKLEHERKESFRLADESRKKVAIETFIKRKHLEFASEKEEAQVREVFFRNWAQFQDINTMGAVHLKRFFQLDDRLIKSILGIVHDPVVVAENLKKTKAAAAQSPPKVAPKISHPSPSSNNSASNTFTAVKSNDKKTKPKDPNFTTFLIRIPNESLKTAVEK